MPSNACAKRSWPQNEKTMNAETLDRLMLDCALGQLPPDSEALLDEYLRLHPDAAELGAEYAETVGLTRKILVAPAPKQAFPAMKTPAGHYFHRAWPIAASFLVGAGFMFTIGRPKDHPALVEERPETVETSPQVEQAARTLPFWSYERASLLVSAAKHRSQAEEQP